MARAKWRAVYCVSDPECWGVETEDPEAIEAEEEMITPLNMSEAEARRIVAEHNSK